LRATFHAGAPGLASGGGQQRQAQWRFVIGGDLHRQGATMIYESKKLWE